MGKTGIKSGTNIGGRSIPGNRPMLLARWGRLGYGKLRRFVLVHFNRRYVQSQLLQRKGKCSQCGYCCRLIFPCTMLTRGGLCRVYSGRRWLVCKIFPIDDRDLDDVKSAGGRCEYYWD